MNSPKPLGKVSRALLATIVVLLLVGAIVGLQRWMKPPTKPEVDVGRVAVEMFLNNMRAGKAGEAWDESTAEFKSIEGRESFVRSAAKAPVLKEQLQFISVQEVSVKDEPRSEYIFQSPDSKLVRVLVGYEGGSWKVDRLTL